MPARVTKKSTTKWLLSVSRRNSGEKQQWFTKTIEAKNKREAEKAWNEFATEINKIPKRSTPQNITVVEFYAYYKQNYSLKEHSLSTQAYNDYLFSRINMAIGHAVMHQIKPHHILDFLRQLPESSEKVKSLSSNTVRKHYDLLKQLFSYAKKWQFINSNPCDSVDAPSFKVKEKEILTKEELDRFIDLVITHAPARDKLMIFLAFALGLRREEIFGLQWKDIDWEANLLHISRAIIKSSHGSNIQEVTPKTVNSIRTLSLPKVLLDMLKEYRKDSVSMIWLFSKADGTPSYPDSFNTWLKRFCIRHSLAHISPHTLRHMAGSYWLSAGLPITQVSRAMGHGNKSFTLKTYLHSTEKVDTQAATIMDDIIKKRYPLESTSSKGRTKLKN